jgi:formylglycine-generating enzyme required for sulfatase activity
MTVAEEPVVDIGSVRMAIEDLMGTFPAEFTEGRKYLERADRIAQLPKGQVRNEALKLLQRESLLENPLLDFDHIVVVRRRSEGDRGLPANWQGNERLRGDNYTNDLALLSLDRPDAPLKTVFSPEKRLFVGDLDLDFDGKRLLFSMPGQNGRWQVHEITVDPAAGRAVPRELPTIPDADVDNYDACYLPVEDIYQGEGLEGVPRGTVKSLRLITYHFAYRGMGGQQDPLGLDGPWDIKCVLGTVPVEADGSALFYVPANTPISFQPLDDQGKAIQLMRSWSTAMPGEKVSCTGCHEPQNSSPPSKMTTALERPPSHFTPWYGPVRGFSFRREVESVIAAHCATCHPAKADKNAEPSVAPPIGDAYVFVRRHVRTPTIEPDIHVLEPFEYHADTTELVRMLRTGHYGVELDPESWDRLITWIDLNTPRYGSWTANVGRRRMGNSVNRRRELMTRYAGIAGIVEDPDAEETVPTQDPVETTAAQSSAPQPRKVKILDVSSPDEVGPDARSVPLEDGSKLKLVRIPPGAFRSGTSVVRIEKPYWMSQCEITNRQYAMYDPDHDSRLEPLDFLHFDPVRRRSPLNGPDQPVVKISWDSAVAYCRWLWHETGLRFDLPTEEEWEWACRAGTETSLWYGDVETAFAACENLADAQFHASISGSVVPWRPAIVQQDDGHRVSAPVGSFRPNPWGLYDMHGNVAEWTASEYCPLSDSLFSERTVRGGAWSDRPKWATSEVRWKYREFRQVYNVGFRVVLRNE